MKERPNRVSPGSLHSVSFRIDSAGVGIYARGVTNLSTGGVGLLLPEDPSLRAEFERASKIDPLLGELAIGERAFQIRLRIVHASGETLGAHFVGLSADDELTRTILEYFDVELAGLAVSRKDAPPDTLKFAGQNECELELSESGGKLRSFRGKLFGNPFEGGFRSGVRISSNEAESSEIQDHLRRFLENIPGLPASILKQILAELDNPV